MRSAGQNVSPIQPPMCPPLSPCSCNGALRLSSPSPASGRVCRFHKTKPVLLCNHWQTFHTEDILSVSKYQNQFLGTSSYNGDILFWNVNMLKPILKFNASQSPSPLLPKRVWSIGTRCSYFLLFLLAVGQNHIGPGKEGVGSILGSREDGSDLFWRRLGAG